jgi:hypothetical protein
MRLPRPRPPEVDEPHDHQSTSGGLRHQRFSIWYWLFHPIQAYWIMFLVREAFRYREKQADRRAATNGEKRIANRAIKVGRKEVRDALHRINRLVAEQRSAIQLAERRRMESNQERDRLRTPKVNVDVIVIPPLTMADARSMIKQQSAKIFSDTAQGDTRHLDAPSRGRRAVAYGLLTVDIAAIFIVFVKLFNIDLTLFPMAEATPGDRLLYYRRRSSRAARAFNRAHGVEVASHDGPAAE